MTSPCSPESGDGSMPTRTSGAGEGLYHGIRGHSIASAAVSRRQDDARAALPSLHVAEGDDPYLEGTIPAGLA
jgi:hypothetical protein